MTVHEGMLLCGRYRLQKLLGSGGTADVYRAFDEERQAPVAVKVLHRHLAANPDLVRRFRGEAEALAVLDHPNIVRLYALEEADAEVFIVLDYVAGTTLRDRLAARPGPLDLGEASRILRDLCGALHYAHRRGIVHQDLKPGNVILQPDGRTMLTDFGIARALGSAGDATMTMGTPPYMSPEQIRGDAADAQSDIYSLGVVLYEMVAGRRPFTGGEVGLTEANTTDRLHEAHLWLNAPAPRAYNPRLPAEASAVILRALAKRSRDRWPDVLSLRLAWEAASGAQLSTIEDGEDAKPPAPKPAMPERPRRAAWVGLLTLGVVVALAALGFVVTTLLGSNALSASAPILSPVPATATAPAVTSTAANVSPSQTRSSSGGVVIAEALMSPTPSLPVSRLIVSRTVIPTAVTPAIPAEEPTLVPTITTEPSATPSVTPIPTATAAPTRPPAFPTPTATVGVRTPVASIGGVTLVAPSAGAMLQGRVTFEWQNAAGFTLGPGQQYELVFWQPDEDGLRAGRSPVGASDRPSATVDTSAVEQTLGLPSGQLVWGVRLWGSSGAVRMLSEGRGFSVGQLGGGGGGGGGTSCEKPPCK